jgi:hypothetical protein
METSGTQNEQIPLIPIHGTWLSARRQEVAAAVDSWLDGVLDAPALPGEQTT